VILEDRIYVYQLHDLIMKDAIETAPNPDGISVLKNDVLICPDKELGTVRINHFKQSMVNSIKAHEGPIRCLALNNDSSLLATASEKGTLIRIFETKTGNKVKEVRRGADAALIYSIAFNPDSTQIAVTSDKGTCHLFHISSEEKNTKSVFSGLGGMLPSYFSSEWGFASFTFDETGSPEKTYCAFSNDSTLILISVSGKYYKLNISDDGKEVELDEKTVIDSDCS